MIPQKETNKQLQKLWIRWKEFFKREYITLGKLHSITDYFDSLRGGKKSGRYIMVFTVGKSDSMGTSF